MKPALSRLVCALTVASLLVTSCHRTRQEEDATAFFKQTKSGSSPDCAILLQSAMEPSRWDHVITVHGFVNDAEVAQKLVNYLNNSTNSNYRVALLNH
jgi:hypothetical protein